MGGMGPLIFFSICPFLAQYLYAQCCFDFDWPARSRVTIKVRVYYSTGLPNFSEISGTLPAFFAVFYKFK